MEEGVVCGKGLGQSQGSSTPWHIRKSAAVGAMEKLIITVASVYTTVLKQPVL